MTEFAALLDRVRARDRAALARAFSVLERDPDLWSPVDEHLPGTELVVAVSGPPGAGKSTLLGGLLAVLAQRDMSCALVAFDPTSPISGGALLGDRIRMLQTASLPNVFVRSVAARDPAGAGTPALPALLALLRLYAFDFIFLESVGAGQEATPLLTTADAVMVVLAPGLGDSVQMLKAGVLELADLIVVNKADRPGAEELIREVSTYFRLVAAPSVAPPAIVRTIATENGGIGEVADALLALRSRLDESGVLQERRRTRTLRVLEARVRARCLRFIDEIVPTLLQNVDEQPALQQLEHALYRTLAQRLLAYAEERDTDRSSAR